MSKPESEPSAPGPETPARTGPDAGAGPGADAGTGAAPTTGQDPRVDFRKGADEPEAAPVHPEPEATPADPAPAPAAPAAPVAPAPLTGAVPPPAPADPWAAPDLATAPVAPAPPVVGHPQPVPLPSAAPPPPPHPLPAGGWASVTPSAQAGFRPDQPYPQPAGPAPTNGFAVGSLVTGLVMVAPVALVFGIVALVQINRRKERGFGLAVAGVVLGTIGTLLLSLLLGAGNFSGAGGGRFAHAPKAPAGSVHWSDLKTGDCYNSPAGGSVTGTDGDETVYWVNRVACAEPHHGEVAGTVPFPTGSGAYPGESEVRESAARLCRKVMDDYALDQWAVPDGMDDVYLYPTANNWAAGERYATCAFEDRDDQHRGTVRTDRSRLTAPQLAYLEAVRVFNDAYLEQPKQEVSEAGADYRSWARRMAVASRTEAAVLGAPTTDWPADVRPNVAKLVEAQSQAAPAWDSAASADDLEGGIRRAKALVAKTVPVSVDIRRALGLSTGEQVPDLRV